MSDYETELDLPATHAAGAGRRPTEIAPGLWAYLPSVVTVSDVAGYDVTLTLNLTDEGLRPVGVNLRAREGSDPINTATLRGIPLAKVTRAAIENAVLPTDPETGEPSALFAALVEDRHKQRPDDESLRRVAEVYRLAELIGAPVSKYVQQAFELPRSTATYWIRAARERGYLEPIESSEGNGSG